MTAWSFKGLQEFFVCPDAERNKVPVANTLYTTELRLLCKDHLQRWHTSRLLLLTQLLSINPGWYDRSVSNLDTTYPGYLKIEKFINKWIFMKLDQQSSDSLKISFVESQCTFYVTLQNCNHNTYHKILKKTNSKEIPIGLNC